MVLHFDIAAKFMGARECSDMNEGYPHTLICMNAVSLDSELFEKN